MTQCEHMLKARKHTMLTSVPIDPVCRQRAIRNQAPHSALNTFGGTGGGGERVRENLWRRTRRRLRSTTKVGVVGRAGTHVRRGISETLDEPDMWEGR